MDEKLKNPFVCVPNRLADEKATRERNQKNRLTYGVKYLDDIGGIGPTDTILVTSKSGGGKSEFVTHVAMHNAMAGKRVHMFALESAPEEVERRIKYKRLADAFYKQKDWQSRTDKPNYSQWLRGNQEHVLGKFESEVDHFMGYDLATLFTRYRVTDFKIEDFKREVLLVKDETDLIIVDHLHYFDFDDQNENRAMKDIIKQIKDVGLLVSKPVILVVHIRKQDKKLNTLVPGHEDIHGSSDIGKIATHAIAIASAQTDGLIEPYIFPTYIRVTKNREDSTASRYVALCSFNARQNKYDDNYVLGRLSLDESEFKELDQQNYPDWAKSQPVVKAPLNLF